ncbi:hypothetical protein ACFLYL_04790 [Chloroflexota bacterium]
MVKATHKPPSRLRYENNNPTISFRVSREVYDKLKAHLARRDVSFANFVKESLGVQQTQIPDVGKIKQAAWNEGYRKAKATYEICLSCSICQQPITVRSNSQMHKAIIDHLEGLWSHGNCHED